jgi:site-specific DNA-methyltransferase (adenine-specific)
MRAGIERIPVIAAAKEIIPGACTLYRADMEEVIPGIEFEHIFTDPPYLYLKEQFDCAFDEEQLIRAAWSILKDEGFIVLFGRGTAFYRWNSRLAEQGFVFKEEIVWNKHLVSNICGNLLRCHETVSIHTKKNGKIRKSKIPYVEMKAARPDLNKTYNELKRRSAA